MTLTDTRRRGVAWAALAAGAACYAVGLAMALAWHQRIAGMSVVSVGVVLAAAGMLLPRFATNSAAVAFMVSGAIWMALGTLYGAVSAIHLVSPEFFGNIPFLNFGRSRPAHVNTVIYGFVTATLIGAAMYYVPALLKTRLWSERLGWASLVFWNAAVLSGPLTFGAGYSQGREYTEYVYVFDLAVMLTLLSLLGNMVMTLVNRREPVLYVSVWYIFGMMLWTAGVYPIGNVMWNPYDGALPGLLDSVFLWYYGHNLVGLLLTPLAVGAAYYVIPRVTRTPLYSHTLSLIGFFMLVALYTHIGGHHILQSPVPNWLKTVSVVDSIAMIIPVFTVLANLWLTARGKAGVLWHDPAARLVFVGTLWYAITCIQGPLQSLPSVQAVTHFTNWTVGHAHIAVLGFSGFIALGAMWHVLPLALGRDLYSHRLVSVQFGLLMFGLVGFFLVLSIAGLIQGQNWFNGRLEYTVLPEIVPYFVLRALSGLFIISAAIVGVYNVLMTLRQPRRAEILEPEASAP
jgi:cbb3-type cytochrome c oxidase subunit I